MRNLDIYQDDTLIATIKVTDISLDKVDDITIDSDGDIVDYTPRKLSSVYEGTTTLVEIRPMTSAHRPVDTPEYYIFPSGTEVIDLSENLSSLGGQVVQYVARSTRIDGKNKGKRVEDLRKAMTLLQRELRRVVLEEGRRNYCPTPE